MIKNAVHPFSLLVLIAIVIFSSCSSPKRYSSRSSKKTRTERTSRSTVSTKKYKSSTTAKRTDIVKTAKKYIGKPYTYGGKTPSSGFDCSGFTAHVFKNNGVSLSGPSHSQAKQGKRKSKRNLEVGDLIFFGKNNKVSHVGIVADTDSNRLKVIHSTSSRGVVIDDISNSKYWQSRYLFARDILN